MRHYHATGLLPEPARDGSGYRRYGVQDLVALVRIVRLRGLGMPIAQIASRVGTSEESLAASLRALADDLDHEVDRLVAARDKLREMAASEAFEATPRPVDFELMDRLLGDRLNEGQRRFMHLLRHKLGAL